MGESGGCHKEPSLCLATWHRDCAPIDYPQHTRCRLVMARQQCISPNSSEVSCSIKVRTRGHSNLDLFRTCDSGVALCLHTSMMVFPRRCSPSSSLSSSFHHFSFPARFAARPTELMGSQKAWSNVEGVGASGLDPLKTHQATSADARSRSF